MVWFTELFVFDDEDADSIIKFKYGIRAIIIISKRKADGESCRLFGMPGAFRTRDLSLRSLGSGWHFKLIKALKIPLFLASSFIMLLFFYQEKV